MIWRRLIAWLLAPSEAPDDVPETTSLRTARDLDEFGRLLSTGKAEDLKKIARDLGQCDNVRSRGRR